MAGRVFLRIYTCNPIGLHPRDGRLIVVLKAQEPDVAAVVRWDEYEESFVRADQADFYSEESWTNFNDLETLIRRNLAPE